MKNNQPKVLFSSKVRVYMEDTDAEGIVYYVNYLKFMERARSDWLRAQAVWQHALQQTGKQFVVSDCQIKYRRPARLDDELQITLSVSRLGRVSITFLQEVWRGEELLCDAEVKVACVSCHNMAPTRLPEALSHRPTQREEINQDANQ